MDSILEHITTGYGLLASMTVFSGVGSLLLGGCHKRHVQEKLIANKLLSLMNFPSMWELHQDYGAAFIGSENPHERFVLTTSDVGFGIDLFAWNENSRILHSVKVKFPRPIKWRLYIRLVRLIKRLKFVEYCSTDVARANKVLFGIDPIITAPPAPKPGKLPSNTGMCSIYDVIREGQCD